MRHGDGGAGALAAHGGDGFARPTAAAAETMSLNPLSVKNPQFAGQGQARHSPVHERRAVARRYLRSQAAAGKVCRQDTAGMQPAPPSARPARRSPRPSNSRSTARAASKSATYFRKTAQHIDDMCIIRSMQADVPNHEPSLLLMNCGDARLDSPQRGLVGHLRPGLRKPESARLHRHVPRRLPDPGIAELAGRFPARRLSGHLHRHPAHARSKS